MYSVIGGGGREVSMLKEKDTQITSKLAGKSWSSSGVQVLVLGNSTLQEQMS